MLQSHILKLIDCKSFEYSSHNAWLHHEGYHCYGCCVRGLLLWKHRLSTPTLLLLIALYMFFSVIFAFNAADQRVSASNSAKIYRLMRPVVLQQGYEQLGAPMSPM
jgi:hypothetical protein